VLKGFVLGIDGSNSMIETARKLEIKKPVIPGAGYQ